MHETPRIHQDPKKLKGDDKKKARVIDQFIAACGGVQRTANFLQVSKQHVNEWRQRQQMGRIWAYVIGQVDSCVAAGFTKEFIRPDLDETDWQSVRDDKRTQAILERSLAHMIKFQSRLPNA